MADDKDASKEALLNLRRAYTTGGKLGARQMFVFNEDGTIAGLKKVEPVENKSPNAPQSKRSDSIRDKKFGKLSSQMSVSGMSVAESKVAFSDANYLPKEGQAEGARIGRMFGKPGITIWNLLLVPLCLFFSLLSGATVMQSMTQILKDDDFYGLDTEKAGKVTANSLSYAQIVTIPFVLVIGFLYDSVGRKITTVTTFVVGAITTQLIPIVAPSVPLYDVVRVIFIITLVVLLSNPFINDYVTVQSRGIATGFQMLGLTIGNLISIGGVFTLTEAISNKIISYGILAAMQMVWAVLVYLMIQEPDVMDAKEERRHNRKSFFQKLASMFRQVYKACKQDTALLISLIGLMPSRNTANLQQSNFYIWIASDKFGLTAELQRDTWQKQNIISNACALVLVFIVGRLTDKVSPKILVPAVLVFQIIIMLGYMFCEDPTSWYAYFLSAFQGGSGFIIIVAMQGYAVKRVPKMIRGIVMALIISLSGLGGLIYLQISKVFFTTAPNMVFGVIGLFDALVLVLIVISIMAGWYGGPPPQEDTFEDGNTIKNENATADFVKDHDFDDDIPDVPLYKDIYDEHIPEMSSDREASSFHTKRYLQESGRQGAHRSRVYSDSEDNDFIGTIRATSLRRSNERGTRIVGAEGSRYRDLSEVGTERGDAVKATLRSIADEEDSRVHISRRNKTSTVNRSDSDEEAQRQHLGSHVANAGPQLIVSNMDTDRGTYVPASFGQRNPLEGAPIPNQRRPLRQRNNRRKVKRSNSAEAAQRGTLIQEMLAGSNRIVEEGKEEDDEDSV